MTDAQARTAANVVIGAAAVGAAVIVLRSPQLRRIAWQVARSWTTGPLAAWVAMEIRRAWDESATAH